MTFGVVPGTPMCSCPTPWPQDRIAALECENAKLQKEVQKGKKFEEQVLDLQEKLEHERCLRMRYEGEAENLRAQLAVRRGRPNRLRDLLQ